MATYTCKKMATYTCKKKKLEHKMLFKIENSYEILN